uniref:Putative secreted protein n=1 Tax=Anopheles darlingi TaxID=43151 RepID=A0A2M4DAP2_ANODA
MFFPPRLPLLLLLVVLVHLKMLLLQPSRSWSFRLTYAEEALAVLLSLSRLRTLVRVYVFACEGFMLAGGLTDDDQGEPKKNGF